MGETGRFFAQLRSMLLGLDL